MNEDAFHPFDKRLGEIYSGRTPEAVEYPGGVIIRWREIEAGLQAAASDAAGEGEQPDESLAVLFEMFGEIAYQDAVIDTRFRAFFVDHGVGMLAVRSFDSDVPGYTEIFSSEDLTWWDDFVRTLNSTSREGSSASEAWQELLEEQFIVCAMRALRRAFPGREVYAGSSEETSEDMMARVGELAR